MAALCHSKDYPGMSPATARAASTMFSENLYRLRISGTPPIVRIHFYDPQSRSYTYLYPAT